MSYKNRIQKMELKSYFETYVEYMPKKFYILPEGYHYTDDSGNASIGRTNTGSYVYEENSRKNRRFTTYCENIKVDFLVGSIFGSIEHTVGDSSNEQFCLKNIKGYLEIETSSSYYIENVDLSQIKYCYIFIMHDRILTKITETLLKESKKIKTSFMAKVSLNLEGKYKKLHRRRFHSNYKYIDYHKSNRHFYDSSTSSDSSGGSDYIFNSDSD